MKISTFKIHFKRCGNRRKRTIFDPMCESCNKHFCNKSALRLHTRTFHTNETMVELSDNSCDICSMDFKRKAELTIHMRIHIKYDEQCQECQLTFATRTKLGTHINKCHPDVAFQCQLCEKKFSIRKAYQQHRARVHPSESQVSSL